MLLIATGSVDATCDLLIRKLGDSVFRFNYDLFREYEFFYSQHGWRIANPAGREITSETASAIFWWKPFNYFIGDDRFVTSEIKYMFKDLYGWFISNRVAIGSGNDFHNKFGKINILSIARDYFRTPESVVSLNLSGADRLKGHAIVAKSLSSEMTSDNKALFTTEVDVSQLHPKFPWFLQEKIDSDWDVTVFICGERTFSFKRDRRNLKGLDWRAEQDFNLDSKEWLIFEISDEERGKVISLSKKLNSNFGRFDFMIDRSTRELVFLEYNASGQWAFLDLLDEYGLLDCVCDWLKSQSRAGDLVPSTPSR